jgi:hypothetical protein
MYCLLSGSYHSIMIYALTSSQNHVNFFKDVWNIRSLQVFGLLNECEQMLPTAIETQRALFSMMQKCDGFRIWDKF